jgi:hypothetical protein
MLGEPREELWILAERITIRRGGAASPPSGSQTAAGFLLDLPHRSMPTASMLPNSIFPRPIFDLLAVSVSSANLTSNFLAIAVNYGSVVLKTLRRSLFVETIG